MSRLNYSWVHLALRENGGDWDGFAAYSPDCRTEFKFGLENLENLNGFAFSPSKSEEQFKIEIAGDASDKGLFAFLYGDSSGTVARRRFTAKEAKESSTYREILVLHETYCPASAVQFSGKKIRHLTDNKAVEWILKIGHKLRIILVVSWRSRNDPLLQIADSGSLDFDDSSFSLDFNSFLVIMDSFGYLNLSLDAMAQF